MKVLTLTYDDGKTFSDTCLDGEDAGGSVTFESYTKMANLFLKARGGEIGSHHEKTSADRKYLL